MTDEGGRLDGSSGAGAKRANQTRELVEHLQREGPKIRSIAKKMGESEATVRYWYRERLTKKGFVVGGTVNHERIGLRRVHAIVKVSRLYMPAAVSVFEVLNDYAYFVGHYESLLGDRLFVAASVPEELYGSFVFLLTELTRIGFFERVEEIFPHDWFRNLPMKTEFYDFNSDEWEMDLSRPPSKAELSVTPPAKVKFDKTDLMIVKRLQVNASATAKQLASRLGLKYKKVLRHRAHLEKLGLIPFYDLRWLRTTLVSRGKALTAKHQYFFLAAFVKDLEGGELRKLMDVTHRLPFVWSESGGHNYMCELAIPLRLVNETLTYLKGALAPYSGRCTLFFVDASKSMGYTISPELYDEKNKKWTMDVGDVLARVSLLALPLKRQPKAA